MSLEQQISSLVDASNRLTETVDSKVEEIDKTVTTAEQNFSNHMLVVDRQMPFLSLEDPNADPVDKWTPVYGTFTTALAGNITAGSSPEIGEGLSLSKAAFRGLTTNFSLNVFHIKWVCKRNPSSHPMRLRNDWNKSINVGNVTHAFYYKHVSGRRPVFSGHTTRQLSDGWELIYYSRRFDQVGSLSHGYMSLPDSTSFDETGEFLISCEAWYSGVIPLDNYSLLPLPKII
ncbi:hypothetical protein AB4359_21805 [Vibrio splendidus]